jgi:two-component system, OmpR family, sensor histidine kinase MtrB
MSGRQRGAATGRATSGWRGLRVRIMIAFALGGLGLSLLLAAITYELASRYLLAQREQSGERQAYVTGRELRDELLVHNADTASAVSDLQLQQGSNVVVHRGGRWFATSLAGYRSLPEQLRRLVRSGQPGHQRVDYNGDSALVVGVPIPAVGTEFFEISALNELNNTLAVIRNSLIGAAAVTTLLGGLLGLWAARRVLHPLSQVSSAAAEIAQGDLSTRLEIRGDRDLERLAESFNQMVDALRTRIERDARFASSVSHELRSPLTTLATASELLEKQRAELPDRARAPVEFLAADVRRFQRLVEELLELSRAESGVDEIIEEPVRLADLIGHMAGATGESTFTLEIDSHLADAPVVTDKRRLERVLTNLFENARIHGRGVTAVAVRDSGDHVSITVDDAGPGVTPEDRERVFEPFYRGAVAGQRDRAAGTGLGLALVAEHTRVLGGRAWTEDAPGTGGARFVIVFPRRPA